MKLRALVVASLLLAGASAARTEAAPVGAPEVHAAHQHGTGLDEHYARSQARVEHLRNQRRLASLATQPPTPKIRNTGDVVVIEDHGRIIDPARPPHPFDLPVTTSYWFRPTGGSIEVSATNGRPRFPARPTTIEVPVDGAIEVGLPFSFPFFGQTYTSAFVHENGSVTFGAADPEGFSGPIDAALLLNGPPRVAPFLTDLDMQGQFFVTQASTEAFVVNWSGFQQAVLYPDGTVRFIYEQDVPRFHPVPLFAGIAPGGGVGPATEVDFSTALPLTVPAGAVFQEFAVVDVNFDLAGSRLSYLPAGIGYGMSVAPAEIEPASGSPVTLDETGSAEVPLPFAFPFFGSSYSSLFVNSNGDLTFGASSPAALGTGALRFLGGPPRVAALFARLRPDRGGSVTADISADRLVVTWLDVPRTDGSRVTVQARLESTGGIAFTYGASTAPSVATVGLSAGGYPLDATQVDFSDDAPLTATTVFELFGPGFYDPFDLVGHTLRWTPTGDGGMTVEGKAGGFDPLGDARRAFIGVPTALGCADFEERCEQPVESVDVPLAFAFPFMGGSYDHVFVNTNGTLTFGAPDPAGPLTAGQLVGGPPRLAPMGADFTMPAGSVTVEVRADRTVVTYLDVLGGATLLATNFQVVLWASGVVDFVYFSLPFEVSDPLIVGISAGTDEGVISETDLTALPASYPRGAIFEEFTYGKPRATVDYVQLLREFYAANPDRYDFVVLFTDFPVDQFGTIAFNIGISNHTLGLGQPVYDFTAEAGSAGELESLVGMGNVNDYWPDAERMVNPPIVEEPFRHRLLGLSSRGVPYGIGLDSPMSILAHEVGHRWLAKPRFVHPETGVGFDSFDLLGRQFFHWSFYADTTVPAGQFEDGVPRSSVLEGNVIADLGPGPVQDPDTGDDACTQPGQHGFVTDPAHLHDGYNALDQYLMGLRPADEVGPFFYVDHAVSPDVEGEDPRRFDDGANGVFTCGHRVDLSVEAIQRHPEMGPRMPALGDEDDDGHGTDVKTMAFVLLTQNSDPKAQAKAAKIVDTWRRTFEKYGTGPATGGRGRFDTSLDPKVF